MGPVCLLSQGRFEELVRPCIQGDVLCRCFCRGVVRMRERDVWSRRSGHETCALPASDWQRSGWRWAVRARLTAGRLAHLFPVLPTSSVDLQVGGWSMERLPNHWTVSARPHDRCAEISHAWQHNFRVKMIV